MRLAHGRTYRRASARGKRQARRSPMVLLRSEQGNQATTRWFGAIVASCAVFCLCCVARRSRRRRLFPDARRKLGKRGRHQGALTAWVGAHPFGSAALYVAAYILTAALSLPQASLLTVVGGLLFGSVLGCALAITGATIGASILLLVVRSAFAGTCGAPASSHSRSGAGAPGSGRVQLPLGAAVAAAVSVLGSQPRRHRRRHTAGCLRARDLLGHRPCQFRVQFDRLGRRHHSSRGPNARPVGAVLGADTTAFSWTCSAVAAACPAAPPARCPCLTSTLSSSVPEPQDFPLPPVPRNSVSPSR